MALVREGLLYSIGEVAERAGISPATVRTWEREDLIQPRRTQGRHRLYTAADAERLCRIVYLRRVEHLNVAAIKRELGLAEPRTTPVQGQANSTSSNLDRRLGRRLRTTRTKLKLSLNDVASKAGVSPSFLSAVERGHSGIAMSNLIKVAHVLGMSLPQLQGGRLSHRGRVVRPSTRPRYEDEQTHVVMEDLITQPGTLGAQISSLPPDTGTDQWSNHSGEEFILMLSGQLEFWINDEHHRLSEGDSLFLVGNEPHRWWNHDKQRAAVLLWVWANLWRGDGHVRSNHAGSTVGRRDAAVDFNNPVTRAPFTPSQRAPRSGGSTLQLPCPAS